MIRIFEISEFKITTRYKGVIIKSIEFVRHSHSHFLGCVTRVEVVSVCQNKSNHVLIEIRTRAKYVLSPTVCFYVERYQKYCD